MAAARSCGILLYRVDRSGVVLPGSAPAVSVWIAHMGGPFWAKKDAAAWSLPKGEPLDGEDDLTAALREFAEEIGSPAPDVPYVGIGEFRQSSGKIVVVFAAETDFTVDEVVSNTFETEWPPRSGKRQSFPEIDRAEWVPLDTARTKLVKGQQPVLDALVALVEGE
jgi:predicted NUDIX family NTP pyrophosphohydrolase